MLRYLFGPVDVSFAREKLLQSCHNGACVFFDGQGKSNFTVRESDSWQTFASRLPAGWNPDFIALYLPFRLIPEGLWQAPIPIVGIAPDWHLLWHHYRRILKRCDLVLSDHQGAAICRQSGISQVREACLFGCDRRWRQGNPSGTERDIDILFVGNFHADVPSSRLASVGRLASWSHRWHIMLAAGVFQDEYVRLLARARIVFTRSLRGEGSSRIFEAIASGALVFVETENTEVRQCLNDREHCVYYTEDNLEALLAHYLTNESERLAIVQAAQHKMGEFTWEHQWSCQLSILERELPSLVHQSQNRATFSLQENLLGRAWQLDSIASGNDSRLEQELTDALQHAPRSAPLLNALGLAIAGSKKQGSPVELLQPVVAAFQKAWQADPGHVVAGLNLAEALLLCGEKDKAVHQASRTLAMLERQKSVASEVLDGGHFPQGLELFRLEWEKAAWQNAGRPEKEAQAKQAILRWRLHSILADKGQELVHFQEACQARPDLSSSHSKLGQALMRSYKPAQALFHLQEALSSNPFDLESAKALFQGFGLVGRLADQQELARQRRLLAQSVPKLAPLEAWFKSPAPLTAKWAEDPHSLKVAWLDGPSIAPPLLWAQEAVANRLRERGHDVQRWLEKDGAEAILTHHLGQQGDIPTTGVRVFWQSLPFGTLPRHWLATLNGQIDEIWASDHFSRDILVQSGIESHRVYMIPWCVAPLWFEDGKSHYPLQTQKQCKFLFSGEWSEAHGLDLLLQAYEQVFSEKDDVCLIIQGTPGSQRVLAERIAQLQSAKNVPEIEIVPEISNPGTLRQLFAVCDCLVAPFRAANSALTVAQAMACGLPVIVTGYGAVLDFCRNDNSDLLPARVIRHADKSLFGEEMLDFPRQAEPSLHYLRLYLKDVITRRERAQAKVAAARAMIAARYQTESVAALIETRLLQLRQCTPRRQAGAPRDDIFQSVTRPRVSLAMIVKNEEDNLPHCLESVRDLVQEVVVVDTGSTDQTVALAQQLGAKVFHFPWIDNFAAARNESLRRATGEWVFWMDADDRLDESARSRLRTLIAQLPEDNIAFAMKCYCPVDRKVDNITLIDHIRLFRNHPQLRWRYRVHEQILLSLRSLGAQVRWTEITIRHVGYQEPSLRKRKLERDLRLLGLDNEERPDDSFTLFNMGAAYHEQGKHSQALAVLRRSLELSHPEDSISRKLYSLLAQTYLQMKQYDLALETCQEGRRHFSVDAEILFTESLIRREIKDVAGAIACLELSINSEEGKFFASVDPGLRTYKAHYNVAMLQWELKCPENALAHWQAALQAKPDFLPAWLALGDFHLAQANWARLEEVIENLERFPVGEIDAGVLRSRYYLARKEPGKAKAHLEHLIDQYPTAVAPRSILSQLLLDRKEWRAAEAVLEDLLQLVPHHENARLALASLRRGQGAASFAHAKAGPLEDMNGDSQGRSED